MEEAELSVQMTDYRILALLKVDNLASLYTVFFLKSQVHLIHIILLYLNTVLLVLGLRLPLGFLYLAFSLLVSDQRGRKKQDAILSR